MRKFSIKLILFFVFIVLVSSSLSFLASTLFSQQVAGEIRQDQRDIAESVRELYAKTNLSLDEILCITSTSMYEVRAVEPGELELRQVDWDQLEHGEAVFLTTGRFIRTTTLIRVNGDYIRIGLQPQNTIFTVMASRMWDSLLFYVAIAVLLVVLMVNIVVKPIRRLSEATREIAKGNFDVQVDAVSNDEIGQLTENFNRMVRELKSIEYLRKDFISNVSHEFKTPIASIQGFARLLQSDGLSPEERAEYAEIIVEETGRLSRLSSNMMKLSKLETQEIVERGTPFALDEQIRKSIVLLEPEWETKGITFNIELVSVMYQGNEELLHQVWLNLLGNAIKFSEKGGTIDIRLWQQEKQVFIEIADQGIGMDAEVQSRIFEKFYQGEKAHFREGSGLGLALVKRIIEMHGGRIDVESVPGQGSTFTVRLPDV
ncbi:MAG: HAMP domain-containing histidine kinase [Firmicutes bacterium]|nr:HAMP domain-containing histidine kinase [Bacillota bacterium]